MGAPDYVKIVEVHLQLNSNAALVHSNLGKKFLRLLYITVLPTIYNTLLAIMFIPPSNPGAKQDIHVGITTAQISALSYAHITAAVLLNNYDQT